MKSLNLGGPKHVDGTSWSFLRTSFKIFLGPVACRFFLAAALPVFMSTVVMAQTVVPSAGLASSQTTPDAPSKLPEVEKHTAPVKISRGRHWFEVGLASWYGMQFQGRRTATGEKFDMNSLTCAHKSLPLGSWVRVTNLRNRKSVLVRVNDRGPAFEDRVIDLSFAAARAVGLGGLGQVRIEPATPARPPAARTQVAQAQIPDLQQLIRNRR